MLNLLRRLLGIPQPKPMSPAPAPAGHHAPPRPVPPPIEPDKPWPRHRESEAAIRWWAGSGLVSDDGPIETSEREAIEPAPRFDLAGHLRRQAAFSARTFGPGPRVAGVCDHIAKELQEVRDSHGALAEWVDVIILGFDGAWRSGATPEQIIEAMVAKQTKNEGRRWPDWRTAPAGQAIEHDRSADDPGDESHHHHTRGGDLG